MWAEVPAYDHLTITWPDVDQPGRYATHTFLFHTERGLYVGAWNEQPADTLHPRLSGRDSFGDGDGFEIIVDSSGAGLYGYWFLVKLGGSLSDGTLAPERAFSDNWDGPWRGEAQTADGGWTAEMFLPWSMMQMPEAPSGRRRMGIYIARFLGKSREIWGWPALPATEPRFISGFQPVELDGVAPRQEATVFPYVTYRRDEARGVDDWRTGVDVFWRLSPAFFVSAVANPDFGQVEADDVVVNLTAYETFHPEKRLFFLESQEVFGAGGRAFSTGTSMLHTRRMGSSVGSRRGGPDLAGGARVDGADLGKPVDLRLAAKAVGQTGKSRFGVLAATEDRTTLRAADGDSPGVAAPGRDFGALRWQRENTDDGGRRAVGGLATVTRHPSRRAATGAVDVHWRTPDGVWNWDAQAMASDIDGDTGVGGIVGVRQRPRRGQRHWLQVEHYDDAIDLNDIGFLSRNDETSAFYEFSRMRSEADAGSGAESGRVRDRSLFALVRGSANGDGRLVGGGVGVSHGWTFRSNAGVSAGVNWYPAHWDDRASRGHGAFRLDDTVGAFLGWNSDGAARLSWNVNVNAGTQSMGGMQRSARVFASYRPAPRYRASLGTGYSRYDAWLLWQGAANFRTFESTRWQARLRLEAFATARQHLQLQINWIGVQAFEAGSWLASDGRLSRASLAATPATFAISDVTVQFRYRWQIAPLSDLFVVYNRGGSMPDADVSRSFSGLFRGAIGEPQREALVVKLRYRFGL